MELTTAERERYLERLGLQTAPRPDHAGLSDLVARHLETVPFENLDIVGRRGFSLTTRHAVEKLVWRRRGGFCFEINEAFCALLSTLGFTVRRVEGRVWQETRGRFGDPFDHLALVVTLDDADWLVDVGFGDNNRAPLRLPDGNASDISGHYRLRPTGPSNELVLERLSADERGVPTPLYLLSTAAQRLESFEEMCSYHQTSPHSIFTGRLICTRATPSGRLTLTGNRLIETRAGQKTERQVNSDADRAAVLHADFGIASGA